MMAIKATKPTRATRGMGRILSCLGKIFTIVIFSDLKSTLRAFGFEKDKADYIHRRVTYSLNESIGQSRLAAKTDGQWRYSDHMPVV
jgi:hypothetical protein